MDHVMFVQSFAARQNRSSSVVCSKRTILSPRHDDDACPHHHIQLFPHMDACFSVEIAKMGTEGVDAQRGDGTPG